MTNAITSLVQLATVGMLVSGHSASTGVALKVAEDLEGAFEGGDGVFHLDPDRLDVDRMAFMGKS